MVGLAPTLCFSLQHEHSLHFGYVNSEFEFKSNPYLLWFGNEPWVGLCCEEINVIREIGWTLPQK